MFKQADRVKETSTTTGTGTYSLAGAATGFQTFVAGVGTGNTCIYAATDGTDWEVGVGTVTDATPDTLSRDAIISSSNAGAAVNWAAGTRDIYVTWHAHALYGTPYRSNEWYAPQGALQGNTVTRNYIHVLPVHIQHPVLIDYIGVNVSASGTNATGRIGIYKDSGGYPGALVLDCGTVDASTTGQKTINISSTRLLEGHYHFAYAPGGDANHSVVCQNRGSSTGSDSFAPEFIATAEAGGYYNYGSVPGSMPDPFPGTSWSASMTISAATPRIFFQVV